MWEQSKEHLELQWKLIWLSVQSVTWSVSNFYFLLISSVNKKWKNLRLLDLTVCNKIYPNQRSSFSLRSTFWTAAFLRVPLFLLSHVSHMFSSLPSLTQGWIHSLWPLPSYASITSSSSFSASFPLTASHWSISSQLDFIHTSTALENWDIWPPGISLF